MSFLKMKQQLHHLSHIPYIAVRKGYIFDINSSFTDMAGYVTDDFLQKPVKEALYKLLMSKMDFNRFVSPHEYHEKDCMLFTKTYDVRVVDIRKITEEETGDEYYIFSENEYSRPNERYPFLKTLMQINESGMAVFCPSSLMLLMANRKYYDLLEPPYSYPQNTIGQIIYDIIPGWEGSILDELFKKTVIEEKPSFLREVKLKDFKNGTVYWNVMYIPLVEHKHMLYLICSINDITDSIIARKTVNDISMTLKKQRIEYERRIREKDDFFYYITHELKTPLTIINAAVQAIETLCKDEMTLKMKKFVYQIKQNSLRLLRHVNNLLDITKAEGQYLRINSENIDVMEFTGAIYDSVSLYAKVRKVNLEYSPHGSHCLIRIDGEKYERILLNLLSNSIKFTNEGKSVKITLECKYNTVYLEVIDEGVGIPYEKHNHIFEAFKQVENNLTRNIEGSGLGLYLVKLLVKAMGGSISIRSKEGEGSTFTVLMPYENVKDNVREDSFYKTDEKRLIKATEIEFSDLYTPFHEN
jgi:signal transduction histidine kinase